MRTDASDGLNSNGAQSLLFTKFSGLAVTISDAKGTREKILCKALAKEELLDL